MFHISLNDFLKSLLYNPASPMVFNSVLFILLFSVFYVVYVIVYKNITWRNAILLLFSLFFYYKISGIYVLLLILIAGSDFIIGKAMFGRQSKKERRGLLLLSLFINLGLLVFFKYTNFFLGIFFGITTQGPSPVVLDLITPIGISYFIFKTLSYTIDVYRQNIEKPETNFLNYLLYVSFFPNILSGPILRASELLPQFRKTLVFEKEFISKAILLVIFGAFKKIVIADVLAVNLVDRVFDSYEYFTSFEYLMAGYGYLIQLYFDFSGYTDMVIGIAMLLGYTSTPNFNKPFLAQNVTEFWRRWHITLSTWLRDYLFSPLSIKIRNWGTVGVIFSVFITFFLCGLWHGANLTFIVWGSAHGLIMGWDILTRRARMTLQKKVNKKMYKVLSIFITFHVLMATFIIFRAPSLLQGWSMLKQIFSGVDFSLAPQWIGLYKYPFVILILGIILHYTPLKWNIKISHWFSRIHWSVQIVTIFAAIIFIYQFFTTAALPFIYLDF